MGRRSSRREVTARMILLRELGAEPVAYGEGLLERVRALAPEGVDAAMDFDWQ